MFPIPTQKRKMKRLKWRNRHSASWICYILSKTVVALIILEGLNVGGSGGMLSLARRVDGASTNSNSSQYYQSGFEGGGSDYDRRGGGGGDSFISTFRDGRGGGGEASKRMRDRCGRYSLLRVLQQWENLQRRCRLGIRNSQLANRRNGGRRYEYDIDDDNFDMDPGSISAPPPPSSQVDDVRRSSPPAKRSRHPYYGALTLNNYYDNDGDDPNGNGPYRNTYHEVNGDALESCCPVSFEVIAPIYGRNRNGRMVELFKDEKVHQEFFEYRCHADYLGKPCRYMDSHHRRISKCVQQYLDTYALVRSDSSMTGWSMEHIRVGSGCACKVDPVKAAAASRRRKKLAASQQQLQKQKSSSASQSMMGSRMMRHPIPDFLMSRSSSSSVTSDEGGGDINGNDKRIGRGRPTPFRVSSLSPNGNIDY